MRPARQSYDVQLRELGIEPAEVKSVIMTHLHVDHTSGMRLLPNAQFTCSREEWQAASGKRLGVAKGYVARHLPTAARMRLLDFDRDGEPYETFAKTIDLLGDGSLRLIFTPGHTVGHMSMLVRTSDGREVLVVGDAAYTLRNIREQTLPMLSDDDNVSLLSLAEIDAFARAHPEAILVPSHDPEAWKALG
jgi:glyoxylase-like metal-dependent hydrolase (beta-lactamase superfamily II)